LAESTVGDGCGGHRVELLDGTDMLCLSGGVSPNLPICIAAIEQGIPLSNDAQLFLERCPATVVGITGSAGKTTTTTLVGQMCDASARMTWIGGNIGDVLLDNLVEIDPNHIVVMELSSFQLELMSRSPQIACVLNVTQNHLDRHGSMENYMAAKSHIFLHQNTDDLAIFGYDDPGSNVLADQAIGRVAWFSQREMVPDGSFMAGNRLMVVGSG